MRSVIIKFVPLDMVSSVVSNLHIILPARRIGTRESEWNGKIKTLFRVLIILPPSHPPPPPPTLPLLRIVWLLLECARAKIIISLVERERHNLNKLKFRQFLCVSPFAPQIPFFCCLPSSRWRKVCSLSCPPYFVAFQKLIFSHQNNEQYSASFCTN